MTPKSKLIALGLIASLTIGGLSATQQPIRRSWTGMSELYIDVDDVAIIRSLLKEFNGERVEIYVYDYRVPEVVPIWHISIKDDKSEISRQHVSWFNPRHVSHLNGLCYSSDQETLNEEMPPMLLPFTTVSCPITGEESSLPAGEIIIELKRRIVNGKLDAINQDDETQRLANSLLNVGRFLKTKY